MSQPKYRLHYFDARGVAETIRFIFASSGTPYEDVRVKREDWPGLKPKTPFKQLPYLEVDGEPFGQSTAIARFLARKYNLAGKTDVEQQQVDAIADYQKDVHMGLIKFWFEPDQAVKAKLTDEYIKKALPDHLDVLESHLKTKGDGKFFIKSGPTFADFAVAIFLDTVQKYFPDVLAKHELMKAHVERVHSLPGIKEWVAKRPQTEF